MQQECQPSEAQPPARDGTATWAEFRRLRRLSRLAWAILAAGAFVVVGGLGWFFAVGQFTAIAAAGRAP